MPSTSWRRVHFRGLPGFLPTGSNTSSSDARIAHCLSVRSWRAPAGGVASPQVPRGGGFFVVVPLPADPPSFPAPPPPPPPPRGLFKKGPQEFFCSFPHF